MENMLSHVFFCFVGGDLLVSGGVQASPDKLRSSYFCLLKYIWNFMAFWYF